MSSGKETWDVINLVLYPGYSVYTDSSMYIVLRLYINLPVVHTVRHITLMIKGSVRENWNLILLILLSKQIKKVATFNSDRKKNSKQIIQILQLIIIKFHNIFVYLWSESYFWNIYSCLEDFWTGRRHFYIIQEYSKIQRQYKLYTNASKNNRWL